MPQDQLAEEFELIDTEVSCQGGLFTFLANDSDANMGFKDHAHIVASISDGAGSLSSEQSDLLRNISLLGWRAPTNAYGRALSRQSEELLLESWVAKYDIQCLPVYHQQGIGSPLELGQPLGDFLGVLHIGHREDLLPSILEAR